MSSLKDNKSCRLLEQYLSYLIVVKGRSTLTADEYRIDCNMLFEYIKRKRGVPQVILAKRDFSDVDTPTPASKLTGGGCRNRYN